MNLIIYNLDIGNETEYISQLSSINGAIKNFTLNEVDFKDGVLYVLYTASVPASTPVVSLYPVKTIAQQTALTNYIQGRTVTFFKALDNDLVLVVA